MMGAISENVREDLLECFYGIYRKDAQRVVDALIGLNIVVPAGGDVQSIRRAVAFFLDNIQKQVRVFLF
jgi:predicted unusual protein kinase regulating ubiquinone biosynthesis (AarF/ABC1/UbiB family)